MAEVALACLMMLVSDSLYILKRLTQIRLPGSPGRVIVDSGLERKADIVRLQQRVPLVPDLRGKHVPILPVRIDAPHEARGSL